MGTSIKGFMGHSTKFLISIIIFTYNLFKYNLSTSTLDKSTIVYSLDLVNI